MIQQKMVLRWACAIVPALVSLSLAMTDARSDTVHHDLNIYLDPNSSYFEATDRISFSEVSRKRRLVFRLAPNFQVKAFAIDHDPLSLNRHGDRLWTNDIIDPSRPIEISYRGRLSSDGTNDRWFVGPEGVYLPAGSGWFPTTMDDKTSFRITITVPDPFRAVVPGRLVFDQLIKGEYRAKFSIGRAFESPVLFAGPYVIQERFQGSVRLRTYFHPEVADLAETYLNNAARYLDAFTPAIGRYPFDTLKMVSSPLPVGLGFPGIMYVSRRILPLPFMQTRSLAHEILHNWWGNGVFVRYDSGNWAEGLTTYMADHAIATAEGQAKARMMRASWLRDYAALPISADAPVSDFRARGHDASQILGYNKIAMVFHMLRQEIGEAAFDTSIREFWRRHKFRTASWQDLQQAFEAVSGQDLGWFFEQWLERPGAPELVLWEASTAETGLGNGYRVSVTIGQSAPTFRILVPIVIETVAGTLRRTVRLEGLDDAAATIIVPDSPLAVAVDPDFDVFRRLSPEETPPILRNVTLAENTEVFIATRDPAMETLARVLTQSILHRTSRVLNEVSRQDQSAPLLLMGKTEDVDLALQELHLGAIPEPLAARGTARIWSTRSPSGTSCVIIAADDLDSFAQAGGLLHHYLGMSYLVVDGQIVIDKGLWKTKTSPLRRRLIPAVGEPDTAQF